MSAIDKSLTEIARRISMNAGVIFNLGLKDGASGTRIKNADEVIKALEKEGATFHITEEWRGFHTKKVRQIYGAGLDVAKAHRRMTE